MNLSLRNPSADQSVTRHLDRIAASLLAVCPVLQHYRSPLYNAALTVMVLLVPYLLYRVACRRKEISFADLRPVAVLIVYMLYRVVDHGSSVTELGQSFVLIVYFAAAAFDCIDTRWLCRSALTVACIASLLLLVQYISFFLFDHHLQLVPTSLLLPSADQWVLGAKTGMAGITGQIRENGFYRPSAFFLEPSHVYIYLFPHLAMVLLGKKHGPKELAQAVLLSLGLVLCTSSMGIAVACAAWGLFIAFYNEQTQTFTWRNLCRRRTKIVLVCAVAAFVVMVIAVPQIRMAVTRIFVNDPGKKTAIGGRIDSALKGLKDLNGKQWIFGVSDTTRDITYNMPGFIASIRRHGLIGMVLSMEFYTKSVWKLKMPFWFVALVIVGTSFFSAHTHSTVGMMYFVLILMQGYKTCLREKKQPDLTD